MRRPLLALCALFALRAFAAAQIPDLYQQIAARHGVPVTQLYQRTLERSGWVNEHRQLVAWPWTVQMGGQRYQFRDRLECSIGWWSNAAGARVCCLVWMPVRSACKRASSYGRSWMWWR